VSGKGAIYRHGRVVFFRNPHNDCAGRCLYSLSKVPVSYTTAEKPRITSDNDRKFFFFALRLVMDILSNCKKKKRGACYYYTTTTSVLANGSYSHEEKKKKRV